MTDSPVSKMNAPVVGLVGCGRWGALILRDLRALGCDVPVVARSEASRERARSGGASAIVADLSELPALDGVIVATPTSTHADVVEGALARGVPVYVEKPMCDDADRAQNLADAHPQQLFVMDKWRYHPGVRELARLLRSGDLGAPVGIVARRVAWGTPHRDVGPLWTYLPHDLAIVLEVFGYLPPPRVVAPEVIRGNLAGATMLLGDAPWVSLEVSISAPGSRRELRLIGEEGCAVLDGGYADSLLVSSSGPPHGEPTRVPIAGEMPLLAELRAFLDHLRGGEPPMSSAADGAAIVELIAKVHELISLPNVSLRLRP
jgi:predicted dehydrogenase